MNKKQSLTEWFDDIDQTEPSTGIMKIVQQVAEPETTEPEVVKQEEPEEIKTEIGLIKAVFLSSLIKASIDELLKSNNKDLTKEYKSDIIDKIEKLKAEIEKC